MSENLVGKIAVKDLEIRVKKGLYPSELKLENHFKVSAEVRYDPNKLSKGYFLDYEKLADIIQKHMYSNEHLLENIAEQILSTIKSEWPMFKSAQVTIEKLNPSFLYLSIAAVVVEMRIEA